MSPRGGDRLRVDAVGDGGDQNVAVLHCGDDRLAAHRLVVGVRDGVEQLAHSRLCFGQQAAGNDDSRLYGDAAGERGWGGDGHDVPAQIAAA